MVPGGSSTLSLTIWTNRYDKHPVRRNRKKKMHVVCDCLVLRVRGRWLWNKGNETVWLKQWSKRQPGLSSVLDEHFTDARYTICVLYYYVYIKWKETFSERNYYYYSVHTQTSKFYVNNNVKSLLKLTVSFFFNR